MVDEHFTEYTCRIGNGIGDPESFVIELVLDGGFELGRHYDTYSYILRNMVLTIVQML